MKNLVIAIFASFFLAGCGTDSTQTSKPTQTIHKLTQEEVLELAKKGQLNLLYAKYEDKNGDKLNTELKNLLDRNKLGRDFYGDKEGNIKRIEVHPLSQEDTFFEIQLGVLLRKDYFEGITFIPVDCSKNKEILEKLFDKDQNARNGTGEDTDDKNQVILLSLLEECGFPTKKEVGEKGMDGIFFVLQHSYQNIMAYYYGDMQKATTKGVFEESTFALMQDRLLMHFGHKQIYGTQIIREGLYDLEKPSEVNKRREKVGLPPIEEYLKRFELNYEEEMKRMETKNR